MATQTRNKRQDKATRAIFRALRAAFPKLPDQIDRVVYRYNPVAIRPLVVDERFEGLPTASRFQIVDRAIAGLPEEITDDISLMILRSPREMLPKNRDSDLKYLEFEDPARSDL